MSQNFHLDRVTVWVDAAFNEHAFKAGERVNCAYLSNRMSIDVARMFQSANPDVVVFYCGYPLDIADEAFHSDIDADRRAARLAAQAPVGSTAHLVEVETPTTIH